MSFMLEVARACKFTCAWNGNENLKRGVAFKYNDCLVKYVHPSVHASVSLHVHVRACICARVCMHLYIIIHNYFTRV